MRKGAPVFVAMEPRRGSESLRCFRGAAVAAASSRTAAVARRIAAALLVLKLGVQNSCYGAVSCSLAAPRLAAVNDDLFAAVLSIWLLRVQLYGAAGSPKTQS